MFGHMLNHNSSNTCSLSICHLFVKIHLNLRLKFHQCRGFSPPFLYCCWVCIYSVPMHPYNAAVTEELVFPFCRGETKVKREDRLWVKPDERAHFEMKSQGPPALKSLRTSLSCLHWMQIYHGIWALHYHGVIQHDLLYPMIEEILQYRASFLSSMHAALHQSYYMHVSCGSSQDRSVLFFRHVPIVGN